MERQIGAVLQHLIGVSRPARQRRRPPDGAPYKRDYRALQFPSAHNNSGHCWRSPCRCANNVQTRSNGIENLSGQPLVTMGGGALPLPMPTQPATLTAMRVATKATSTFFIGIPLSSRHAIHTSCLAAPLVARQSQWFTGSGDSGTLQGGLCPLGHSY